MKSQFRSQLLVIGIGIASLGAVGCAPSTINAEMQDPMNTTRSTADAPETTAQNTPTQTQERQLDVPYVPTPTAVVNEMLRIGKVTKNDVLYDLGSGDGRIVITAAKKFGTRGFGIDLDPQRVKEANQNAQQAGVSNLVQFRQQDLFQADLSNATVVTLYLLPEVNLKLRSKLISELKPGTRIVSHAFDMGDWKPEQVVEVNGNTIYYWTVPNKAAKNPV
jgi:2-polyprenyl-3-methyl-5-hydroxy-6-metoxy-1,4-benzoquinol methylase